MVGGMRCMETGSIVSKDLSCAVTGVKAHLGPVEGSRGDVFIPALLDCTLDEVRSNSNFRQLLSHGCKKSRLNIPNPVASTPLMCQSSVECSSVLVKLLRKTGNLDLGEHQQCVKSVSTRTKEERMELELHPLLLCSLTYT